MLPPGHFHQPIMHNFMENFHQDAKLVTSEDAVKFKAYMGSDKVDFNMTRPGYVHYHDKNMEFSKDRRFWLSFLLFIAVGNYAWRRFEHEKLRARRTERVGNI